MIRRFDADVDDFSKALESVFQGKATVLYRMRLSCAFSDKDGNSIGNEGQGIRVYAFYSTQ
jgi:NADH kinase